jgi:hypothetical protein
MRIEPDYEGIYDEGVHIVHEWEAQRIRITCNFSQITLSYRQAKFVSKYLAELETNDNDESR